MSIRSLHRYRCSRSCRNFYSSLNSVKLLHLFSILLLFSSFCVFSAFGGLRVPSYRSNPKNRVSSPPLYTICFALVDRPIVLPNSFVVNINPCAGFAVFFFKKSPICLYVPFNSSSSAESNKYYFISR